MLLTRAFYNGICLVEASLAIYFCRHGRCIVTRVPKKCKLARISFGVIGVPPTNFTLKSIICERTDALQERNGLAFHTSVTCFRRLLSRPWIWAPFEPALSPQTLHFQKYWLDLLPTLLRQLKLAVTKAGSGRPLAPPLLEDMVDGVGLSLWQKLARFSTLRYYQGILPPRTQYSSAKFCQPIFWRFCHLPGSASFAIPLGKLADFCQQH